MLKRKFDEMRLTGALPTPSGVGLRILELTRDEEFDQASLARAIMGDPALAGRIVSLANSALHEGAVQVTTVRQACTRLGTHAIRTIALGFTLVDDNRRGRARAFDYDAYWSESLACAVAASHLALDQRQVDPIEAFTMGLLGNIGRLALASVHPERYDRILGEHPHLDDANLALLEARDFEIDHHEVAHLLMRSWGLGPALCDAVLLAGGHAPEDGPAHAAAAGHADVLVAARCLARAIALDPAGDRDERVRALLDLTGAGEPLGLADERLLEIGNGVGCAWVEWGTAIGVPTGTPVSLVDEVRALRERGVEHPPARHGPSLPPRTDEEPESLPGVVDDDAEAGEHAPRRLLLVDDDERMLRLLAHHLRREGFEVHTATSSEEGLRLALELSPQILITDWMMPGMTGVELVSSLRRIEAGKKMYVLVVTAREDDERVVEAFRAGADDYIVKPFNPRILLARVHAGLRMIRMRERVEQSERAQLRQVAELGILTRRLRSAALTDALTELPNRRYALRRLKQEWDHASRTGAPLSVVVADVDHFKSVNDQYGHDVGDQVLREVAAVLREHSRSGDVLARLGGEEFLSIHVAGDLEMARQAAERLRDALASADWSARGVPEGVTMSFGVAQRDASMDGVDDLIRLADEALYGAKRAGRNRVETAPWGGDGRRIA